MTRDEREALSQRICNFYCDSSNKSVKTTVHYFVKQNIPRRTIYYISNKYLRYGIARDQPRSGRPLKLSNKKLNDIVKSVNNRSGISQRKIGRRFHVHHSTISRNLRRRTSIRIRKRQTAPKMDNDEEFFTFTGDNVIGNRFFYSTDLNTAPVDIKFRKKKKFESKIMYHQNGNYLFWPDLASAHYSKSLQERSNEKSVPFVIREDNPPNVPQARPIETVWTLLERKVYENNWEAKNLDVLARIIKKKSKELDQKMLQDMIDGRPEEIYLYNISDVDKHNETRQWINGHSSSSIFMDVDDNEIDEQMNDLFSINWGKEYSTERLKLKHGKEIHFVL
ncbi:unnamed protein product [Rotaria magnacalcarata]|uniref:Uncharacterized protein n=2 Tax=Rotaria magnacalcarata TaxID=392030 RepID=A0A816MW73_9BILA|nr:unnamed protein product [Rotaria magnacalcarata]